MVDEQHFTNNGDTGENLMNQAQAIYAQAAQEFDIAKKYRTNCEFWKVVLGTLLEEEERGHLTRFEFYWHVSLIRRRLRRNKRMHAKVQRRADRALRKYHKWLRRGTR
jgi:hypothetical protein